MPSKAGGRPGTANFASRIDRMIPRKAAPQARVLAPGYRPASDQEPTFDGQLGRGTPPAGESALVEKLHLDAGDLDQIVVLQRVRRRPATHDLGVDLVVARSGLRAIVQCKRWSRPVGPSIVRDLYGTLLHNGADLGILATTSTISRSAQRFAQGKPLLLLDGAILRLLLSDLP